MVGNLEMEPSMQKSEGVRADDICGRSKLAMRERFLGSKIRCRTREVGEDDLQSSVSWLFVLHHETYNSTWTCKGLGTMFVIIRYARAFFQLPVPFSTGMYQVQNKIKQKTSSQKVHFPPRSRFPANARFARKTYELA